MESQEVEKTRELVVRLEDAGWWSPAPGLWTAEGVETPMTASAAEKVLAGMAGDGPVTRASRPVLEQMRRFPTGEEWHGETDDLETASAPPEGKWEFGPDVTAAFDDMLQRSIPNYTDMRDIVTRASGWLMDRDAFGGRKTPLCVDLGCSRGAALAPLVDGWGARARFLGVDVSQPMLAAAEKRFAGMIEANVVSIQSRDLRAGYPLGLGLPAGFPLNPTVTLLVLTLQFLPIEYRTRLLAEIHEQTIGGGGLILVEKVMGSTADADSLLLDIYHGLKRGNGYTQEAIDRKRLSLEGVLVPLQAAWNEDLLRKAGWATVETLWAWGNFRAWLAVKS